MLESKQELLGLYETWKVEHHVTDQVTSTATGSTFVRHPIADFDSAFPPWNTQEQYLEEKLWWWRNLDAKRLSKLWPASNQQLQVILYDRTQLMLTSIWYYEYRARYNARYDWDFGVPWTHLDENQKSFLFRLFNEPRHIPKFPHEDVDVPNVLTGIILPSIHLKQSDRNIKKAVTEFVIDLVKKERINRGIEKSIFRKPIAFKALEAMDKRRFVIDYKLDDGERSAETKACQKYERACALLGISC